MKLKFDLKKLHPHCIDANSRQQLRSTAWEYLLELIYLHVSKKVRDLRALTEHFRI